MSEPIEKGDQDLDEDGKPTRRREGDKAQPQEYQSEEAADKRARAEINTGRGSGTHNR